MDIRIKFPTQLSDINEQEFDSLSDPDQPFMRYAFLKALELSECVCAKTGWEPYHFSVWTKGGRLLAFSPVYKKRHSYGEYVFDWAWADAYARHGYNYYPKLLASIPFTPSVSARILFDATAIKWAELESLYSQTIEKHCLDHDFSSAHILFPDENHSEHASELWGHRKGVQYHWFNKGYQNFEDFLDCLSSRKRKNIRKERRQLSDQGVHYQWIEANALSEGQFEDFVACYQSTYHVRGQAPYLNRVFFERLFRSMPENCLLLFAFDADERVIASALFIKGESSLYGRYWGALKGIPLLHFEVCYYAGIEYCIEHGLKRFDAGAQGEHKLLRGFEPVTTHSLHYIQHPEFRGAIDRFLDEEREHIEQFNEDAKRWLPYKNVSHS